MNPKLSVLLIFSLLINLYSCKKNDSGPVDPPLPASDIIAAENNRLSAAVTNQTTTAFISGTIKDEEGKTLAGVSVSSGNATVTTNSKGYFQFPGSVTVNKDYSMITAALAGYFKGIRTFTPNRSGKANHYFEIKLLKQGQDKPVLSTGGNVLLDNNIDLTFPDAALVTSSGTAYTGQYTVAARYIDPAALNFLEIMPGLLTGLNDQNQLQALQSFGMAVVELKDASGNLLQIAPGKKVTMKLPAPGNGPGTVPLWHFNEKYGMWIKAGEATKTGDKYTAEVNHFSTWNLDLELNNFSLELQFKDQSGNALSGLRAEAYTDGVNKFMSFYTDNEGKATLINCPSLRPLTIKTIFQCDTISKSLDPLTASRSETITIPAGTQLKSYKITGKLSGCNDITLGNQPFQIAMQGAGNSIGVPGVTDAQGHYTLTGMFCNANNSITVQAIALVNNEYRYAAAAGITLTNSIYNAQICDTASSVADDFQIIFPDPSLNSLIRGKINKPAGPILYGDVKNIDSLVSFATIGDLSGIQFCTNLKILDLRGGANFSDLGSLKNLLSLQQLFIRELGNGLITDISPLRNLTQLRDLSLACPNLSDISPVQNLVNLQTLSIICNNLSDISPVSTLNQLYWLQLMSPAMSDVNGLQNLTKLKNLHLESGLLTSADLDVLKNLTSLIDLTIRFTPISDFSVLNNLPQLLYIHLDANQISDVSQFASLKNLVSLELSYNKITDISALATMTQLQYLKLSSNQITDISSLSNLSQALIVNLEYNKISDVTPLQNLNSLQIIWLNNNQISNINPLINGVPGLQVLRMNLQQQGAITKTQQDAFKISHPACFVEW